jgi:Leucine-rich repeat (LRR) protein
MGDTDTDIVTVDDLGMSQLSGLAPTLKRLSLSRCRWVSSCEPLKGLTQLESLDLSHTDVGPKGLEALAELPALQTLNLTGCR